MLWELQTYIFLVIAFLDLRKSDSEIIKQLNELTMTSTGSVGLWEGLVTSIYAYCWQVDPLSICRQERVVPEGASLYTGKF